MSTPTYSRSRGARNRLLAGRRPYRAIRFFAVFTALFAVACVFWGGLLLDYARDGSFLLLGLTVVFCAIFGGASVVTHSKKVAEEYTSLDDTAPQSALPNPTDDPYWHSPVSPGYLYKPKI